MNEWPPIYVFWSNASRRVPCSAREGLFIKNQRSFAAGNRKGLPILDDHFPNWERSSVAGRRERSSCTPVSRLPI